MRIVSLSVEGFRSYERAEIALDPARHIHVFLGQNGAGKSNIIEAISYLSLARSCLGVAPDIALRWGAFFFRLRAEIAPDTGAGQSVEFVFQTQPERASACYVQDVRTPVVRFIGRVPSVTFLPQDLDIFTAAPAQRRAFIDALIAQIDPAFASRRIRFDRVLKQRNALLRRIDAGEAHLQDLDSWDTACAEAGSFVQEARLQMLLDLASGLPSVLSFLHAPWFETQLSLVRANTGENRAAMESSLLSLLRERRQKDIPAGMTTAGPHRDDWLLSVDGRACGLIASRGQQRTAFIAMLFAAVSLLHRRSGERPILLLDDVFSELDAEHQSALLHQCGASQTIITAAHVIPELRDAAVYDVQGGHIHSPSPHILGM